MTKRNETVTIDGEVCHETDAAWKFIPEGWKDEEAIWLPKSQCEWDEIRLEMEMPLWLAERHKLG